MNNEQLKNLSEREYDIAKINFINGSQQRQHYLEHKYENEYRRDALIALISTGAIGCLIFFLKEGVIKYDCMIVLLCSVVFFGITLVVTLVNFHISSKAFSFQVDKFDENDKKTTNFYTIISECLTVLSLFSIVFGILLAIIFLLANF